MRPVFTGAEVRSAEQPLLDAGLGPELMRRAAHGLAQHVIEVLKGTVSAGQLAESRDRRGRRRPHAARIYGARVAAYVGTGNNGGDALYALATLRRRGVHCVALLTGERCHAAGLAALRSAGGRALSISDPEAPAVLERADVVIDAMLGTGSRVTDEPRPIELIAPAEHVHIVACDLPSGVDAATGRAEPGALRADSTVTFGAVKCGLVMGEGRQLAGEVRVVDIGLRPYLPEARVQHVEVHTAACSDSAPPWNAHKYSRGVVGLIAGSEQYPGAAVLTARSAVNAGIGMLVACPPEGASTVRQLLLGALPEVVVSEHADDGVRERISAWVLGPGVGEDQRLRDAVVQVLDSGAPAVLDASGLAYTGPGAAAGPLLLTPHAGELTALLTRCGEHVTAADVAKDPLRWTRRAAEAYGAVVLLKGPETVIASPAGHCRVVTGAPSTLATAGSGDVLAGLAGAEMARDRELVNGPGTATDERVAGRLMAAAVTATVRHARAGLALGAHGFAASGLAAALGAPSA
ncbi:NAD(P)H-hydrate dehydratase [Zhihengliuella flava]|uniref:ADP-dependent (S)-NAD(P)H-hydrate dehydratase n=1 Tax=Zhihengliuella flava TaxID=1285193 RepID=A0A931DER2_9MICC|nr:NAD(P)H-hydrate dehydratase [Zhihengliuella flava]MBG6085433.1 hydroxyethylthiazole kinase-like uncharacterized protein yjeF [Zhihengliuella flava]